MYHAVARILFFGEAISRRAVSRRALTSRLMAVPVSIVLCDVMTYRLSLHVYSLCCFRLVKQRIPQHNLWKVSDLSIILNPTAFYDSLSAGQPVSMTSKRQTRNTSSLLVLYVRARITS